MRIQKSAQVVSFIYLSKFEIYCFIKIFENAQCSIEYYFECCGILGLYGTVGRRVWDFGIRLYRRIRTVRSHT